jgi:phosphoribosylanthranilate isomerase
MARVKICGITQREDAVKAASLGADAVGFIFYKKSVRKIAPAKAKKIIEALPPFVAPVGVFVNEKTGAIRDIIKHTGIQVVQLHGDEDYHFCHRVKSYGVKVIKAFRIKDHVDLEAVKTFKVDAYLFDTFKEGEYGGTGEVFNWKLLNKIKSMNIPFILSGGLNNQNVIEPVNDLKPFAVDVSSGIETEPGKKDHRLMKEFIDVVKYVSGPNVKG